MKRTRIHRNSFFLFCVLTMFIVLFFHGCGKSADELYTEAMTHISNPDTALEGLKLLQEFETKFANDPRAPEVSLAKASLFQSLRRFGDAITAFKQIQEKYPDSPEAVNSEFLLGYLYYEDLKDTEKAKTVFNNFVKKHPESELALSANILLENIETPVEEWDIIKKIETDNASIQEKLN